MRVLIGSVKFGSTIAAARVSAKRLRMHGDSEQADAVDAIADRLVSAVAPGVRDYMSLIKRQRFEASNWREQYGLLDATPLDKWPQTVEVAQMKTAPKRPQDDAQMAFYANYIARHEPAVEAIEVINTRGLPEIHFTYGNRFAYGKDK